MPTYDYVCRSCDHELELFQSITARPKRKCPSCGRSTLERRIGTGAGILFKGTGFYQTDYRSDSWTRGHKAESAGPKSPDAKPAPEKPASKGDGATTGKAGAKGTDKGRSAD